MSGSAAGDFMLADGTALTVSWVAAGGTVSIASGAMSVSGPVTAAAAATLTAPAITLTGTVTAPVVSMVATGGTLQLGSGGNVAAAVGATLSGTAGVVGSNGSITGNGALAASSSSGAIDLSNPNNVVASVNGAAFGGFTFADNAALVVNSVSANGTVTLAAQTISVNGVVTAPRVLLATFAGPLEIVGTVNASNAAALAAETDLIAPGQVIGGAVNAVSATGSVSLGNPSNQIGSISGSASGSFAVSDGESVVAGTLAAGGSINVTAPSVAGAGAASANTISFAAATGDITIASPLTGEASVSLAAAGSVLETPAAGIIVRRCWRPPLLPA